MDREGSGSWKLDYFHGRHMCIVPYWLPPNFAWIEVIVVKWRYHVWNVSLTDVNNPANIYLFKVNNRNTRKRYETYSKLTVKIPERCQWHRFGVLLLTLNRFVTFSSVSVVDFEQVNGSWECVKFYSKFKDRIPWGIEFPSYQKHV